MANEYNVLMRRVMGQTVVELAGLRVIDLAHGRPHAFSKDGDMLADVVLDSLVGEMSDDTLSELFGDTDSGPDLESPSFKVFEDFVMAMSEWACKHVPTELDLKTERSRAFDRGNYAAAYEDPSDTATVPEGYATHQYEGYLMGFYSSRELHEIPLLAHRVLIGRLRAAKENR